MNARLERKLRLLAAIIIGSVIGAIGFVLARGFTSLIGVEIGILYGLILSVAIGGISQFILEGSMRSWLGGLSFTASLMVRSAVYAAIIVPVLFFQLGDVIAGNPRDPSHSGFWTSIAYSVAFAILANLVIGIANIIGPRAFLNFITGRYHSPVEEDRFVLFVDIAGSTGLAERLGGVAIHRLLDRTFRLLTLAVVDYRGEVLNYVGDEVIVTWRERDGAVDCRPLRCFAAMRDELSRASGQFEREFGAVPRIRGSLHFGPVIVGEIGDVKRAIVFNGDVMNTAARLEELSRTVDGGFLASRTAMERFNSAPPFVIRDLGRLPIRGRADGIDVVGIDDRNGTGKVWLRSRRFTIRAPDSPAGERTMFAMPGLPRGRTDVRPVYMAGLAGLACAFVIGKTLPLAMDAVSTIVAPLCAVGGSAGSALDTVEPIGSYALPNAPGKRVTIVRLFYGPGGFTRAHRHAGSVTAYVTKGEIRSQLGGGPVETFKVGQSFFEPPGATHLVSANASNTEPAELIAVFVADEGAQLTTFIE